MNEILWEREEKNRKNPEKRDGGRVKTRGTKFNQTIFEV